jgi:hypothetical protein
MPIFRRSPKDGCERLECILGKRPLLRWTRLPPPPKKYPRHLAPRSDVTANTAGPLKSVPHAWPSASNSSMNTNGRRLGARMLEQIAGAVPTPPNIPGGFDSRGKDHCPGCATNGPEILHPAMLRAGRLDRQALIDRPDCNDLAEILRIHLGKISASADHDGNPVAAFAPWVGRVRPREPSP